MKLAPIVGWGLGLGVLALLFVERELAPTASNSAPSPRDDEADKLGRVITSEAAGASLGERAAIGWTVRNRARKRRVSIARLVCHPQCGRCCDGRPFSSAKLASSTDRELAAAILDASREDDPTRGAVAFFEPDLQDKLAATGKAGHRKTAAEIRAKWTQQDGLRYVGTVGKFEFYA